MVATGDTIKIIRAKEGPQYNGKVGVVTNMRISFYGNDIAMYGTWGNDAIYFNGDDFKVIKERKYNGKSRRHN